MVGVMMVKLKPLHTSKAEISAEDERNLLLMLILQKFLWAVMIIASVQVLVFWIYTLIARGVFDPTTLQYSVLVAVGAYFCLIVDNEKIVIALKIALRIKTDLPYFKKNTKR